MCNTYLPICKSSVGCELNNAVEMQLFVKIIYQNELAVNKITKE